MSLFWFTAVMDAPTDEVRQEPRWIMMFADDAVICSGRREQVEGNQERWRSEQEGRGMKVSRSRTEYVCESKEAGCKEEMWRRSMSLNTQVQVLRATRSLVTRRRRACRQGGAGGGGGGGSIGVSLISKT